MINKSLVNSLSLSYVLIVDCGVETMEASYLISTSVGINNGTASSGEDFNFF